MKNGKQYDGGRKTHILLYFQTFIYTCTEINQIVSKMYNNKIHKYLILKWIKYIIC